MNEQIKPEFDATGIRIPYPQMDVSYAPVKGNIKSSQSVKKY
ncbi:MAG: hypothetical protein ACLVAT_02765 [Lachnospiraceae bacterium]